MIAFRAYSLGRYIPRILLFFLIVLYFLLFLGSSRETFSYTPSALSEQGLYAVPF